MIVKQKKNSKIKLNSITKRKKYRGGALTNNNININIDENTENNESINLSLKYPPKHSWVKTMIGYPISIAMIVGFLFIVNNK